MGWTSLHKNVNTFYLYIHITHLYLNKKFFEYIPQFYLAYNISNINILKTKYKFQPYRKKMYANLIIIKEH